jgi:hypothetical protein
MNVGFTYELRDNTNPDLVYYGSSELPTLEDRMKIHIYQFNAWKKNNENGNYCSSFKILELGNYTPTLLKIVFFTIKWELREHERKLIEYQTCVNENIPNRTHAEYCEANREQINEKSKEFYQANKEYYVNYNAEYRAKNKDKIKDKKNKKFVCECGGKYTHINKVKHIKTKIHQKWLKLQTPKTTK